MPAVFRIVSMLLALTLWPNEPRLQTPATGATGGRIERPTGTQGAAAPEIIRDLSRLPPRAARTRERILEAARTGDLDKL